MSRYFAIFTAALAVRLAHVWQMRGSPFFTLLMGDSRSYDEWGRRIAGGEWIGREVFYQAPLYPYFLGVVYAIGGHRLLLVRILQAILGSIACVLLARAGERFFSPRAGLIAGLILALYAPAIFFDGLIQKSTLDVFFVCAALWLMAAIVNARRQTDPWWLALGLAIGALTLTRENALVFTVVVLGWSVVRYGIRAAAIFALGVAVVVLPIAIRNSLVGGGFYVTTSQFGPNFYIGNNPRSDGTYHSLRYGRGAPEYERQDATEIAERAMERTLTPAEVSGYWTDQALDFIAGRPGDWLKLMARKIALLVNRTEILDTESQESHAEWSLPLRITGLVGHFGILVPLAVLGLIASWRDRARVTILYVLLAAYAASVIVFYVFARYRYPLVPFLILFAAAGLVEVAAAIRDGVKSSAGKGVAVAIAAVVTVFANWPILSAEMNRAVTEHNVGTALQSEGKYDDAVAHYRKAIALRADYAPAYNNLASSLNAAGRTSEAIAAYEQALRLQPDYPEAHYNLGNALLAAGRRDEAVAHFRRALPSLAASADVHNNLGIALMAESKVDEAIAEFRAAIQAEPASAKAHRNLGDALVTKGVPAEGIEHLQRAVSLDPGNASFHYDLGSALLEAGSLDAAIAELRAALRLDPASVDAHNNLGIALGSQGKLDEAIAEFRAALKIDPHSADAQNNLQTALGARRR